eukprot:gene29297-38819_t
MQSGRICVGFVAVFRNQRGKAPCGSNSKHSISDLVLFSNQISWSGNKAEGPRERECFPIVSSGAEKIIASKNSGLYLPGEFTLSSYLSADRLDFIEKKCRNIMTLPQALSLRKQILIDKVIFGGYQLQRSRFDILRWYSKNSMRLLSNKFDQPAMAIFRLVMTNKVTRRYPNMLEKDVKRVVKFALRYGGNETASALSVAALTSSREAEGEDVAAARK